MHETRDPIEVVERLDPAIIRDRLAEIGNLQRSLQVLLRAATVRNRRYDAVPAAQSLIASGPQGVARD